VQYEKVKPEDVEEATGTNARTGAIAAILEAVNASLEVKRAETIAATYSLDTVIATGRDENGNVSGPTVRQYRDRTMADHDRLERRAGRKLKRAGMTRTNADVKTAIVNHLEGRIEALEREHVSHTVKLQERQAALAETGANAPDEEDTERLEREVDGHQLAMDIIETMHAAAVAERDRLKPADVTHKKRTTGSSKKRNGNGGA
jgi:hypothetical protein